jgi:hypothetical protein
MRIRNDALKLSHQFRSTLKDYICIDKVDEDDEYHLFLLF